MSRVTTKSTKKRDAIKVVIKDNQLVEAKYMFNIWETRFFLTLITMIDKADEENKIYRIWFKDIKQNFKINSNKSYSLLREAAISLSDKSVDIPTIGETGAKRNTKRRLLQFVNYLEKGQKGEDIVREEYIDVAIDKEIQPFLLHVKKNFDPKLTRYTRYDLRNAEKLKPYAVRIYELMKQFEHKGFRTIRIDDMKEMFLITDEYPRFSTFNQSVIVPSVKAINKHTDITIPLDRITKIKKGRKVDALRFVILAKTEAEIRKMRGGSSQEDLFDFGKIAESGVSSRPEPKKSSQVSVQKEHLQDVLFAEFEEKVVRTFGVTPSVFLKVLSSGKYSRETIEQAIRITQRANYNQEIKKNIAGFFLKALKEGFTDPKEEKQKKAAKLKEQTQEQLKQMLLDVKIKKASALNKIIKRLTSADPTLTEKAIDNLKNSPMTKIVVSSEELKLGRPLEIEDFRQIKILRDLVKGKIVELNSESFSEVLATFEAKEKILLRKNEDFQ